MKIIRPNRFEIVTDIKQAEGREGLFYGVHPENILLLPMLYESIADCMNNYDHIGGKPLKQRPTLGRDFRNMSHAEMDEMYKYGINPIREIDGSLLIWGNKVKMREYDFRTSDIIAMLNVYDAWYRRGIDGNYLLVDVLNHLSTIRMFKEYRIENNIVYISNHGLNNNFTINLDNYDLYKELRSLFMVFGGGVIYFEPFLSKEEMTV
jgi:hypothetical protein